MDRPDVFVGSIDQGTTSTRFLIFSEAGKLVVSHQVEFTQIYPNPGWHEQEPLEIVSSVETCIEEAVTKLEAQWLSRSDIKAIGITNQRETTIVWDSDTGEPLYNAIVWTDTRSQDIVDRLKQKPGASRLQQICGLPLSTYSSSTKLLWMLENVPQVREAYERGTLAFGTVDAWLVYRLNGGPKIKNVFVSDPTNASRTMFMNLKTLKYDDYLLDFFGIKGKIHLPKLVRSSDTKAYGTLAHGALAGTPITGCLGDQSAALVGQKGFSPGMAKNTYGTGCFLLYNVGDTPVVSSHGLLATVAYHFDGKPVYALEGSIAVGGSGVKFLQNNLEFFKEPAEVNDLALTVDNNGGCVFVTAFSGLFAPYWIDDARGTIFGITQYTQKGHLARAILEATCFQTKVILDAMEKDSGHSLAELAVDGGMSNSDLAMQIQADLISIPVYRPQMRETTALGAAIAAGLAAGVWRNFTELREINRGSGSGATVFEPRPGRREESAQAFALWEKAVAMSRGWVGDHRHHRGAGEPNPAASDHFRVDMPLDLGGLVGGQHRVTTATATGAATATATSTSKAVGEVWPLQVTLISTSADLEDADEEDLYLELRRVEVLQRLRKVRKAKIGIV
ncbi:glycerol kinase [Aspergillus uvarum CBS 121591]|uniref:glycerol kinase n=1 Tax=Aspergillus uvarum CBS 121591 TaxID=1448315 RepID=A0A319CQC2_9EURO|nr:glycerol kinase [Aspergillus uvarum CBS 121591]PYH77698.1 glycerol kinase [Aspergillus uvarum CBS 121591]